MSALNLISPDKRIEFLKSFVKELLKNSIEKEEREKKIRIEKLKQKFSAPLEPEKTFHKIVNTPVFQPKEQPILPQHNPVIHATNPIQQRPLQPQMQMHQEIPQNRFPQKPIQQPFPQKPLPVAISPEKSERPTNLNLGKIESLLKDQGVQSIECPGPGKNVIVKKMNRPQITNINLNSTEVSEIINQFSTNARIPIVGGILKAAVGDLVISAIISEFVGSRFIINRIIQRTN